MNRGQTLIIWIVAALMVYNIFINNKIKTDIRGYKDKINNIQNKIDSVSILNKQLDFKIGELHTQLDVIDVDILSVESNLAKIQREARKKDKIVSTFTANELQKFFIERYRDKVTKEELEKQININENITYKVEYGNTLYSIAKKNNTSIAQIKKLNNIKGNVIFKGQVLTLSTKK